MGTCYRVLVVCRGNTCRSPMAAAVLSAALDEAGLGRHVVVASAGVFPSDIEAPADPRAAAALAPSGLSLAGHRTRVADPALLAEQDEILAVDRATLAVVRERLGDVPLPRISLLGGYAGGGDIADPFHGTATDYERTLGEIRAAVAGLVGALGARLRGSRG